MASKTAAILTLGCRLNQADSALLSDRLRKIGFEIVSPDSESSPNLIIVNSCSVTTVAARKSRQMLRAIREENPQSFIVMTGCSADVDGKELSKNEDCDLLLTNEQKKNIHEILPRYLVYLSGNESCKKQETTSSTEFFEHAESYFPFKTRAILKVQEGCENFCTYCIVPYARGKERSRNVDETLSDFKQLIQNGFREVVISGVNICNYKCGKLDLVDLIELLIREVPGEYRLRLSSTEPGPIVPKLVSCMAKHPDKICAFLHLPLQNGSDEILKTMGRKYNTAEFASVAENARKLIPNLHLGTDVIVGFPGETDTLFRKSCEFLRKIGFANIHVFPFSPRQGTPAEKLPGRIVGAELDERIEVMKTIKEESGHAFADKMIGRDEVVLVETKHPNGVCEGWSGNYIKTRFMGPDIPLRSMVRVTFRKVLSDGAVVAEIVQ